MASDSSVLDGESFPAIKGQRFRTAIITKISAVARRSSHLEVGPLIVRLPRIFFVTWTVVRNIRDAMKRSPEPANSRTSKLVQAIARNGVMAKAGLNILGASGISGRVVQAGIKRRPSEVLKALEVLKSLHPYIRFLIPVAWSLQLQKIVLENVDLHRRNGIFEAASFDGASVRDCRIFDYISGASFRDASLTRVTIIAGATSCIFHSATLQEVHFYFANLVSSTFDHALVERATFEDVDLTQASFRYCTLRDVVFINCTFTAAIFADTLSQGVKLVNCIDDDDLRDLLQSAIQENTPFGSSPRPTNPHLASAFSDAARALITRYSGPSLTRKTPLGYRIQLATDLLASWVSVTPHYSRMWKLLAHHVEDANSVGMPKHPVLTALRQIVFDLKDPRETATGAISLLWNWNLRACVSAVTAIQGSFDEFEVVSVSARLPVMRLAQIAGSNLMIVSEGFELFSVRLAKYLVAWVLPLSVDHAEDWDLALPPSAEYLARGVDEMISGDGEPVSLPLIRIGGLRTTEVVSLTSTWTRFAILHEMAHSLETQSVLSEAVRESLKRDGLTLHQIEEIACDVFACTLLLNQVDELDGSAAMVDYLRSMPDEIYDQLQSSMIEQYSLDASTPSPDRNTQEWLEQLDLVAASAGWLPTAITAFLLLYPAPAGMSRSRRSGLVAELAFGGAAFTALKADAKNLDTIVGLLIGLNREAG